MFRPSPERHGFAFTLVAVAATLSLPHAAHAHRQHSTRQARFLQRDPVIEWQMSEGIAPHELHSYGYQAGRPTVLVDPLGLLARVLFPPTPDPGSINYGKFCGPTNSQVSPEYGRCPADCLDAACCEHDYCWQSVGASWDIWRIARHIFTDYYDGPMRDCDERLCRMAKCAIAHPENLYAPAVATTYYYQRILGFFRCNQRYPHAMMSSKCLSCRNARFGCKWPCHGAIMW